MEFFSLNTLWFGLVGILLAGYAMLDGFDLGLGALHLLVDKDEHRRLLLNAVGPVWDGNEVWLVTAGGALFAAFPEAYATVFSGFYTAFMLLLLGLIFRAAAIEFRSKMPGRRWRAAWDASYSVSSILSAFLMGVAFGNVIFGIDLDAGFEYRGGILDLLNPYAVLVGITTVALFMMHGNIYGVLKTEGDLQLRLRRWVKTTMAGFILLYGLLTAATLRFVPHMLDNLQAHPGLFAVPVLTVLAILNLPRQIARGRDFPAFLSSCAATLGLFGLFAIGMFPRLVVSRPELAHSIDIFNGASSQKTLAIMAIIAACGVPLVLSYTASIYYVFRGKVTLDAHSY